MNSIVQNLKQESSSKDKYINDLFIVVSTMLYTFLFYQQDYGVNYLLFSLFASASLVWRNPKLLKSISFIVILCGTIFTGALTFYFGTWYHVLMNKISLLLLAALSISPSSSLIAALFHSLFTYITLPIYMIIDFFKQKSNPLAHYGAIIKYLFLAMIPIVITITFLSIYAYSNPILSDFLSKFSFHLFSITSLLFIGYAFLITYGLYYQKNQDTILEYDRKKSNNLIIEIDVMYKSIFNFLSLKSEIFVACLGFVLLNLIIGLTNGLDIYHLLILKTMPINVSFSEYIHQGVNALIASVFLAIFLMMYFFSARLNFIKNVIFIKSLAYLWIVQNGILIYLCFYKNSEYIIHQGLTYKRIGVFFFLVLVTIGLILTGMKIARNKTNFFLIRSNTWALYIVLILFGSYDWDAKITTNNLSSKDKTKIDYEYLLNLDHTALPILKKYYFSDNNSYQRNKIQVVSALIDYKDRYFEDPKQKLIQKIIELENEEKGSKIQSYSISRKQVLKQLKN